MIINLLKNQLPLFNKYLNDEEVNAEKNCLHSQLPKSYKLAFLLLFCGAILGCELIWGYAGGIPLLIKNHKKILKIIFMLL